MSPITHLLASWVVAAHTTDNVRDRRLVTLAGVAPDLDGLGILIDIVNRHLRHGRTDYYQSYHHWLGHGWPAALVISGGLALLAQRRGRVFWLALAVFHLHLLCDLLGSRGPSPDDLWPIFYNGPLSRTPMILWKGQWALDAWPNRVISVALFFWAVWLAVRLGDSFVGVFNRRVDGVFVGTLRQWAAAWRARGGA